MYTCACLRVCVYIHTYVYMYIYMYIMVYAYLRNIFIDINRVYYEMWPQDSLIHSMYIGIPIEVERSCSGWQRRMAKACHSFAVCCICIYMYLICIYRYESTVVRNIASRAAGRGCREWRRCFVVIVLSLDVTSLNTSSSQHYSHYTLVSISASECDISVSKMNISQHLSHILTYVL